MSWGFPHIYYCHDRDCEGSDGFEVRWYRGSYDPPIAPEPERDTCPWCGDKMYQEQLEEEDIDV